MELAELQQGLQNISPKEETPGIPPEVTPWLSMDNLMGSYGNWFDNDQGLGELLLGQLRARGVDTQSAVEAMLRQLLQDIVDDLGTLQQKLTGFITSIHKQMQDTQAVADSVQAALDMKEPKPSATEIPVPPMPTPDVGMGMPPEGAPMPPDTPSDKRIKNVKPLHDTLSDIRMKTIKRLAAVKQPKSQQLSKNILSACLGGF